MSRSTCVTVAIRSGPLSGMMRITSPVLMVTSFMARTLPAQAGCVKPRSATVNQTRLDEFRPVVVSDPALCTRDGDLCPDTLYHPGAPSTADSSVSELEDRVPA